MVDELLVPFKLRLNPTQLSVLREHLTLPEGFPDVFLMQNHEVWALAAWEDLDAVAYVERCRLKNLNFDTQAQRMREVALFEVRRTLAERFAHHMQRGHWPAAFVIDDCVVLSSELEDADMVALNCQFRLGVVGG